MTLLTPQPKPTTSPASRPVWPELQRMPMSDRARALLALRHEQGMSRYGQDLMTHDGRDAWADTIQELADACFYAGQVWMEDGGPNTAWLVEQCVRLLEEALMVEGG